MHFLPSLGGSTSGYYWARAVSEGVAHLSPSFLKSVFVCTWFVLSQRSLSLHYLLLLLHFRRCFRRCWVSLTPCCGPLFLLIVDASMGLAEYFTTNEEPCRKKCFEKVPLYTSVHRGGISSYSREPRTRVAEVYRYFVLKRFINHSIIIKS